MASFSMVLFHGWLLPSAGPDAADVGEVYKNAYAQAADGDGMEKVSPVRHSSAVDDLCADDLYPLFSNQLNNCIRSVKLHI